MELITGKARAYINFGRWITECPYDCGNALTLTPGQSTFMCSGNGGCGTIAPVEWPPNAQELWDALAKRKAPKHRNWFPHAHPLALKSNCPHGQTVKELEDETQENQGA